MHVEQWRFLLTVELITFCRMFRGIYDKQNGKISPSKLFSIAKDDISFLQRLKLYRSLEVHNGCVNSVCWNETGSCILSGSDDQHLVISSPFTGKKQLSLRSGHRANIFSAKFLPNSADREIVSCSGDGKICYTQVERQETYESFCFDCHRGTVYEVLTIPNEPSTFLSCGEDGTVRWFDLRMKTKCDKQECKEDVMIKCRRAVTSLTLNPMLPYHLGVACSDGAARIYDRRMLGTRLMGNYGGQVYTGLMCKFTAKSSETRSYRITSLQYSSDGEEILLSYSSEHLYLFSIKDQNGLSRKLMRVAESESNLPFVDCRPKTFSSNSSKSKGDFQTTVPVQPESSSVAPSGDSATPSTSDELSAPSNSEAPSKLAQIKRLRLRGDWSDTGPNARPASERQDADEEQSPHVTLMQRMSDMLTRWLDSNLRPDQTADSDATDARGRHQSFEDEAGGVEAPLEGAVGGEPVLNPFTSTNRSQQNTELIQNLENIEIPSESQMDITDRSRNLSKMHRDVQRSDENCLHPSHSRTFSQEESSRECHTERVESTSLNALIPGTTSSESSTQQSHSNLQTINEISKTILPTLSGSNESTAGVNLYENENTSDQITTSSSPENDNVSKQITASSLLHRDECDMEAENISSTSSNLTEKQNKQMSGSGQVTLQKSLEESVDKDASRAGNESPIHVGITDTLRSLSNAYHSETLLKTLPETRSGSDVRPEKACVQDYSSLAENPPINKVETVCESRIQSGNLASSEALEDHPSVLKKNVQLNNDTTCCNPFTYTDEGSAGLTSCDTQISLDQESGMRTEENRLHQENQEQENRHTSEPSNLPPLERLTTNLTSSKKPSELRHRRIGYSGPPTGDFQLYSPEDNNSSDENTEGQVNYREDDELERNVAAIKLQSIFRKRKADREERDLEANQTFTPTVKQKFRGHRNARTMIKEANFWGDRYVMSGSDCGHIFFWDRHSTKLVMLLEADKHVVNCLQPHPFDPMLASSGIDYDVKVWAPLSTEPYFDEEAALEIMRRNELMLEETQDTITVPAGFMFRVLASLTHLRSERARYDSDSDTD